MVIRDKGAVISAASPYPVPSGYEVIIKIQYLSGLYYHSLKNVKKTCISEFQRARVRNTASQTLRGDPGARDVLRLWGVLDGQLGKTIFQGSTHVLTINPELSFSTSGAERSPGGYHWQIPTSELLMQRVWGGAGRNF